MPTNELEEHPYLKYYETLGEQISTDYYKGIIVGSFPIYAITNSINEETVIVTERFGKEASMRFFYGSKKSELWKYIGLALNGQDPRKVDGNYLEPVVAIKNCIQLLLDHHLLMSDVLFRVNRIDQSSYDNDLMVNSDIEWNNEARSYNLDLISQLSENKGVENIYFTSTITQGKSPYTWFLLIFSGRIQINEVFDVGLRVWSAEADIDFGNGEIRRFKLFLLPTPKPRGMHWKVKRTAMFENYISALFTDFYNEIDPIPAAMLTSVQKKRLSELRDSTLVECYRQALVYSNTVFRGDNPISC
ncbi:hypothetical protein DBR43_30060 [Pedobacter sp. KBW06]|uniref:hypothetical protein n=1 Tax=Pedobacter sp. KBW06 TaxID=2153359 RepID=UPI000F5AED9A|nr:hypothetical protein [Pedobacter sp. KBW06]RQO66454.1 hypothetical protein DBR43_30060 [Pedobacter sp. KBW06]